VDLPEVHRIIPAAVMGKPDEKGSKKAVHCKRYDTGNTEKQQHGDIHGPSLLDPCVEFAAEKSVVPFPGTVNETDKVPCQRINLRGRPHFNQALYMAGFSVSGVVTSCKREQSAILYGSIRVAFIT
jgi:hypothetical protein